MDDLSANIAKGDIADPQWRNVGSGHLARRGQRIWPPRSAAWLLGHWVHIQDQKIANYQCVVPSTWNCSPRDATGQPGPYEAALIGTPIADPEQPLEILRTIHSFDPCMACGVHVLDVTGREITQITFNGTTC